MDRSVARDLAQLSRELELPLSAHRNILVYEFIASVFTIDIAKRQCDRDQRAP
jgi:hypothetical protein